MNPSRPFILRPVATSLLMVAILLSGFGAGLTWGSALIRWTKELAA